MPTNISREEWTQKLVANLPALRAKMKITQAELAEIVGIGRQTLISIEKGNSKMRWDTFLAMMLVISQNSEACQLLALLGLDFEELNAVIADSVAPRKAAPSVCESKGNL